MAFKAGSESTTDTWLTPKWILDALGQFDLDPCAAPSPRPWSSAKRHYEVGKGQDGLRLPWAGRVWLNPPYSSADPWVAKMHAHGDGVMCVAVRGEVRRWMEHIWSGADRILLLAPRTTFMTIDGKGTYGNVNQTALVAYGKSNAAVLDSCGLNGLLLTKWKVMKGITKHANKP